MIQGGHSPGPVLLNLGEREPGLLHTAKAVDYGGFIRAHLVNEVYRKGIAVKL